jgi:hypothetical protein
MSVDDFASATNFAAPGLVNGSSRVLDATLRAD